MISRVSGLWPEGRKARRRRHQTGLAGASGQRNGGGTKFGLERIGQAVGGGVIAVRPGGRSSELSGKTTAGGECDF